MRWKSIAFLIAYFLTNVFAKYYENSTMLLHRGCFLRHSVDTETTALEKSAAASSGFDIIYESM